MRSILFVPAKWKMLSKIKTFNADSYIIDLEDSISINEKVEALNETKRYLSEYDCQNIFVRIDRGFLNEQLNVLHSYKFRGFVLPKFENGGDFLQFINLFHEKEVMALVETPKGLINIRNIVECPWVDSIAFGAEDFTSCIGMKNVAEYLNFAKSLLVVYAKAYNKKIYDTPSFIIDNFELLKEDIQKTVDMGFDGKLSINPKQIQMINELFKCCDFEYMKNIIEIYEKSGKAVLKIDNRVYEKMHIAHFKRILKENQKF